MSFVERLFQILRKHSIHELVKIPSPITRRRKKHVARWNLNKRNLPRFLDLPRRPVAHLNCIGKSIDAFEHGGSSFHSKLDFLSTHGTSSTHCRKSAGGQGPRLANCCSHHLGGSSSCDVRKSGAQKRTVR